MRRRQRAQDRGSPGSRFRKTPISQRASSATYMTAAASSETSIWTVREYFRRLVMRPIIDLAGIGKRDRQMPLKADREEMVDGDQDHEQGNAKAQAKADQLFFDRQQGLDFTGCDLVSEVHSRHPASLLLAGERRFETAEEKPGDQ